MIYDNRTFSMYNFIIIIIYQTNDNSKSIHNGIKKNVKRIN